MASYTAQKIFPSGRISAPLVITASITSGTVVVEKGAGNAWVPAYTFTATGSQALWLGRGRFRVTPTGVAEYEVD